MACLKSNRQETFMLWMPRVYGPAVVGMIEILRKSNARDISRTPLGLPGFSQVDILLLIGKNTNLQSG